MEVRIKRGIFMNQEDRGFTLVVYKKTKSTLPFAVAKYLESQKNKTITSQTSIEIPEGTTL